MSEFVKDQPKHGEMILHCGHTNIESSHWYRTPDAIGFLSSDGFTGYANWIMLCDNYCYPKALMGARVLSLVKGHTHWIGNEPALVSSGARLH